MTVLCSLDRINRSYSTTLPWKLWTKFFFLWLGNHLIFNQIQLDWKSPGYVGNDLLRDTE